MQSRLATTAVNRSCWAVSAAHYQSLFRRLAAVSGSGRTADPAVHYTDEREFNPAVEYGEAEGIEKVAKAKPAKQEPKTEEKSIGGIDPLVPPKPPSAPFPRLESTPANIPIEPIIQQKRKSTTAPELEEVSCAGLDGTPWPEDAERGYKTEDDKEYFGHHKASPLSEIQVVDTRKPITQATDGTANEEDDRILTSWLPEQLDTAEEALERASRIWKENAMRGDPDTPHGRVLRVMRGEWF
ncbi:hypothetical protein HS088_TW06G00063 [Tripterygium wilfordii]|uniref:Uncharacterized protein n=1 Tax=Tripterygium wilfordii TaxID=458696 RepID=A0A7J7DHX6_TRIWF|nr:uncharacterized protein LOC119999766 [Tripterygium wilfordii]KAF5745898.1 hypothetical protein HS088_TW06G00063 [Tripterygium wilfordii]